MYHMLITHVWEQMCALKSLLRNIVSWLRAQIVMTLIMKFKER